MTPFGRVISVRGSLARVGLLATSSMLANLAAFAFTVALTAIGIWLAMSIAELRKNQDCVLMGRRDCAQISSIPRG